MQLASLVAVLVGFGFFTGGLSGHCAANAVSGRLPASRLLRILPGDAEKRGLAAAAIGVVSAILGVVVGVVLVVLSVSGWCWSR